MGAGQPNRVVSVHLAGRSAGDKATGSVLASDAFFPFPDNIELAAQAGVTAIVQPGGSIRDAEVIEEANKNSLGRGFTGVRHCRHEDRKYQGDECSIRHQPRWELDMPSTIDIVIPVYNEEQALPRNILILTDFLKSNVINPWQIIIADNASTDSTRSVSEMLCERFSGVNYLYLPQKGRGRALKAAWKESTADIVSYMDVDL